MRSEKNNLDTGPDPTVRGALARLGLTSTGPSILAVSASTQTNIDTEQVWQTWSKLEQWPRWAKPLITTARWLDGRHWEVGAQFELVRSLGFPIGRQVTVETVREVNQHQSVAWWGGKGGSLKTCQLWYFESLPEGGTQVHVTEIFVGPLVFLFRIFLKGALTRGYQEAVEGLVKAAERDHHAGTS